MNRSSEALHQTALSAENLNELIIDSIQDIKGKNIVKLDLRELDDAPTDFFIICEGDSNTQIRAISENVIYKVKDATRIHPSHVEGVKNARWVCVDYFNIVVHIFHPEARSFYELDELWSDARITEYGNL